MASTPPVGTLKMTVGGPIQISTPLNIFSKKSRIIMDCKHLRFPIWYIIFFSSGKYFGVVFLFFFCSI
jgi:hypothetical protein